MRFDLTGEVWCVLLSWESGLSFVLDMLSIQYLPLPLPMVFLIIFCDLVYNIVLLPRPSSAKLSLMQFSWVGFVVEIPEPYHKQYSVVHSY